MTNQILRLLTHIIPIRRVKAILTRTDLLKQTRLVAVVEGRITAQQDVNDYTQRPHIDLGSIHVTLQDFRSNIPGRTTIGDQTACVRGGGTLGEAEISYASNRIMTSYRS